MNKWTWLVVGIAVLWALICWNWYVCGIKNLCSVNETQKDIPERVEETRDGRSVFDRERTIRGGEARFNEQTPLSTVPGERRVVRCEAYLTGSANPGRVNDPNTVLKIEQFLNQYQGESLEENGIYEQADVDAVNRFQERYAEVVLRPLGLTEPTGRVLGSTRDQINRLHCALTARN